MTSLAFALLLPFGSALAFYRRRGSRNPLRLLALIGVALLSLGAITSCSGGTQIFNEAPAGTSTITVTGTSGSTTQTTTFNLVVQ